MRIAATILIQADGTSVLHAGPEVHCVTQRKAFLALDLPPGAAAVLFQTDGRALRRSAPAVNQQPQPSQPQPAAPRRRRKLQP